MSNYEDLHPKDYLTHPIHGGKVTCHKCLGFIIEGEERQYDESPIKTVWFHTVCFNNYEHYYGLDKPID